MMPVYRDLDLLPLHARASLEEPARSRARLMPHEGVVHPESTFGGQGVLSSAQSRPFRLFPDPAPRQAPGAPLVASAVRAAAPGPRSLREVSTPRLDISPSEGLLMSPPSPLPPSRALPDFDAEFAALDAALDAGRPSSPFSPVAL
jgi:hypothetical protein